MTTRKQASRDNELLILLDSIYCLHRVGDHSSARDLAKLSQDKINSSPIHKSVATLIDLVGNYLQNTFSSSDFDKLTAEQPNISAAHCLLYDGWSHFLSGYFKKQKDSFQLAVEAFKKGAHYGELLETFYWMDKFRFLPVDEKVHAFLRLYPIKSCYSRILGNTFYAKEVVPLTAVEKKQIQLLDYSEDDHFDCWILKGQTLGPAKYHSIPINDENFLDLYSGLINDRGEYLYLLIGELNCLSYLIASQLVGATLADLVEFLNRPEEETLSILQTLISMGIPVIKKEDSYHLDWPNKPLIIVPRSLKVVGLHEYMKKQLKQFTKAQLIEELQVTQYGAEALLRKWALAGFIKPTEEPDQKVIWKFV